MDKKRIIRPAIGAGRWFPGGSEQLRSTVCDFIDEAAVPEFNGNVVAGIAPHAGFLYSGRVAGYTFRALKDSARSIGEPDAVVVLGFSHQSGFDGVALMDGDAFESPIGVAELDNEAGTFLTEHNPRIFFDYGPHMGEHSAENELPFIQAALPGAKVVVGLIGDHDQMTLDALVNALVDLSKRKRIVVVASTDLLHHSDYNLVTESDKETLALISTMDDAELLNRWDYSNQVCCGLMPVLTVMRYSKALGCNCGTKLYYRYRGDDNPESRGDWVVGYGSVVFSVEAG